MGADLERRNMQVVRDVVAEMGSQVTKWGEQAHRDLFAPVSLFEVERVKAITDAQALVGRITWQQILDEEIVEAYGATDMENLYEELVQVAAVALSWARDLSRRGLDGDILILPPVEGAVR